jgi:hypothetical protein
MKKIRKYRIPGKVFQQACHAFIGGMLNYYIPWIGGEIAINQTIKPFKLAYKEFMRTFTGCLRSTRISLFSSIEFESF